MADDHTKAYGIGYRKPPRHSRFQNRRSGNPRGRTAWRPQSDEHAAASPYEKGHSLTRRRKENARSTWRITDPDDRVPTVQAGHSRPGDD